MLTTSATVPYILTGEVLGMAGGKLWPMLPDQCDRLTLWAVGADMVGVELDLAGVMALIELLTDARDRMQVPG